MRQYIYERFEKELTNSLPYITALKPKGEERKREKHHIPNMGETRCILQQLHDSIYAVDTCISFIAYSSFVISAIQTIAAGTLHVLTVGLGLLSWSSGT